MHGNINRMAQEIKEAALLATGLNVKYIDYEYDLISDKVNKISYNTGSNDQYFQQYVYDADNEITGVFTSRDNIWWDNDAKYSYYNHDPLARIVLGDLEVQGIDYAYTLNGWMKGVNSNTMQAGRDIGKDGNIGGLRQYVGRDAMGYTLGYFADNTLTGNYDGDYSPIKTVPIANQFEAGTISSNLLTSRNDLFNGDISYASTVMPDAVNYGLSRTITPIARGGAFKYDQLQRLIENRSFFNLDIANNHWLATTPTQQDFYENFSYDAMGNIKTAQRWGNGGVKMDELIYGYNYDATSGNLLNNRLYGVNDVTPSGNYTDDIDNQQGTINQDIYLRNFKNNYAYDELGNLKKDSAEEIQEIRWTLSNKVKSITRRAASVKPDMEFIYNGTGKLIVEIVKPKPLNALTYKYTYHYSEGTGNELATYELLNNQLVLTEQVLYGSDRLGTNNRKVLLWNNGVNLSVYNSSSSDRILGQKQYELTNNIGNVIVSITDKKIPRTLGGGLVSYFDPDLTTISDYYSFGSLMPTRHWVDPNLKYRFGYNGISVLADCNCGETYQTTFRLYNSRLGRWWSQDPKSDEYKDESPYSAMENNPISEIDPNGDCPWCVAFIKGAVQEYASQVITNLASGKGMKAAFTQVDGGAILKSAIIDGVTLGLGSMVKKAATVVAVAKVVDKAKDTKKVVAATTKVANTTKTVTKVEKTTVKATAKVQQLATNKAQGAAKEKIVKKQLQKELKPGQELLEQASYKLKNGKMSRPDFTVVDKNTKKIVKIVDAKSGGAKLTTNQKTLQKSGGTLVGKKAGVYKGVSTTAKKIEVR